MAGSKAVARVRENWEDRREAATEERQVGMKVAVARKVALAGMVVAVARFGSVQSRRGSRHSRRTALEGRLQPMAPGPSNG